jgi:hypothetical protein
MAQPSRLAVQLMGCEALLISCVPLVCSVSTRVALRL